MWRLWKGNAGAAFEERNKDYNNEDISIKIREMIIDNLAFDNDSDNFMATVINAGDRYGLTLLDFTSNDEAHAAALADKICVWLQANLDNIKVYAASQLTQLKNDSWLEEDEQPVSENDFVKKVKFESILAFADGSLQAFLDDGDIFWGHSIVVDVDEAFGFTGAGIAG